MALTTKRFGLMAVVLGSMATLAGGQAEAGFLADSMNVKALFPDPGTTLTDLGTKVVSPTAVFTDVPFLLTISDTSIILKNNSGTPTSIAAASFNGYAFTDASRNPGIIGVTVNPSSNITGFSASRVTFTSTMVFVNLQGLTLAGGSQAQLDVTFTSSAAPEPTSILSVGVGMTLLAASRLRRHRRVAA